MFVAAYQATYTYAYQGDIKFGTTVQVEGRWPSSDGRTGVVVGEVTDPDSDIVYKAITDVESAPRPLAGFTSDELQAELRLRADKACADSFGVSLGTYLDIKSSVLASAGV